MRVLHVSKYATTTGGVERHIHQLVGQQRREGHHVAVFSSEDVAYGIVTDPKAAGIRDRLRTTANVIWSKAARAALTARVHQFSPDIVHYHSIYHQLSPSVLLGRSHQVARVMTLHDYKLAAPCYVLLLNEQPCYRCVGKALASPSIRYRCVKESYFASATCVAEDLVHRRRHRTLIDQFVVPSEFAKSVLVKSRAIPAKRLQVIGHGVLTVDTTRLPSLSKRVVFAGRLSPEKAVSDLLEAWRLIHDRIGLHLDVFGDGPQRTTLGSPPDVTFHGWRPPEEVEEAIRSARAVVVPSRSDETFGLTAAEALGAGVPALVSDAGALPEHVTASLGGLVFPRGSPRDLAAALLRLSDDAWVDSAGAAGHQYARDVLSLPKMAERTWQTYELALRQFGATTTS